MLSVPVQACLIPTDVDHCEKVKFTVSNRFLRVTDKLITLH